jgi:hypothetical protein
MKHCCHSHAQICPKLLERDTVTEDWICLVERLAFLHSRELPAVCEAGAEMDCWRW